MSSMSKNPMRGLSRSPIDQSIENLRNAQRAAGMACSKGKKLEGDIKAALVTGIALGLDSYISALLIIIREAEALPLGSSGLIPDPAVIVRAELKNALDYANIAINGQGCAF